MSTGINIASSSGITVGTTAVTSGTDSRVFFQAGGVVQQDGAFNWDNTNKRLGIGANATSPTAALFLRTNTIVANDIVTIQNGQYGNNILRVRDNVTASQSTIGSIFVQARIYGSGSTITGNEFDLGGYGLGASYGDNGSNAVWLNNQGNVGDGTGSSVIAVSSNLYVNLQTTKKYKFETVTGNFGIGNVGTLGARLDVRAQGALSTDIAFRVRNSADTANIVQINGDGSQAWIDPANNTFTTIRSGSSTLIQWGNTNFLNIGIGHSHTMTGSDGYNILIGGSSTINSGTSEAIKIGTFGASTGVGTINIGYSGRVNGSYSIKIGRHTGASSFGGTNSIHLGRTDSGNDIAPDNVFMTYFNSQSCSTVVRSNGSLGLFGQQNYLIGNGTGANGLTTFMGDGGNTFVIRNHTSVPSLNITDSFQQYSADITAGNAAPHFRTENGNIIKLYKQSSAGITTVADLVTVLTNLGLLG